MEDIELSTEDYGGFASACLDLCVTGRPGKPSGNFNRRVEVYLGAEHVNLTQHEWGVELHGGPKLREVYLAARDSFGSGTTFQPMKLVRFIEREIRRHVSHSRRDFLLLLRESREEGRREGREEARASMRRSLGIER